ncbi:MAG: hypothetical protein NXI31_14250 [bacterium]|nr:hypothetical protein [bacterium]
MRYSPLAALFVLAAGCTSVEWAPPDPELPTGWRDYRLFVSRAAFVLARHEDAAAEVHEHVARARAAVAEELGSMPERGLVLALSYDDPLPIEDPDEYGKAVSDWVGAVFRGQRGGKFEFGSRMRMRPGGKELEVDPAIPLHMVTVPIPGDDERLDLPSALVERAKFVALVPTDACLEECIDYMIDRSLEAEGMSRLTYAAITLIVGDPADKLFEKLREQTHETLSRAWGLAVGVDFDREGDGANAAVALPILDRKEIRYPRQMPWFIVGDIEDAETLTRVRTHHWRGVVDTTAEPAPEVDREMAAAGKHYLHLPRKAELPSRAEAERLGEFYDECRQNGRDRFVIVRGEPEYGAALVASHAYYVRGKSVEDALAVGAHYGSGTLQPPLAAELKRVAAEQNR